MTLANILNVFTGVLSCSNGGCYKITDNGFVQSFIGYNNPSFYSEFFKSFFPKWNPFQTTSKRPTQFLSRLVEGFGIEFPDIEGVYSLRSSNSHTYLVKNTDKTLQILYSIDRNTKDAYLSKDIFNILKTPKILMDFFVKQLLSRLLCVCNSLTFIEEKECKMVNSLAMSAWNNIIPPYYIGQAKTYLTETNLNPDNDVLQVLKF
jgi:hypothetical protein